MFSGIIKHKASVKNIKKIAQGKEFSVDVASSIGKINEGDSLAMNGACFTAGNISSNANTTAFSFKASAETLDKTTANQWQIGALLHCENSLNFGDPVGGHLMNGHVDSTIKVLKIVKQGEFRNIHFELPHSIQHLVLLKGSVAIDGVSLTVNGVDNHSFWVTIIPHTILFTEFAKLNNDSLVNLEIDMLARYLERQLATAHNKPENA